MKVLFLLSKASEHWTTIYPACRKNFVQGYQKWNLYFMSSEYHVGEKNFFESFVIFPFVRTWNINFLDLWQQRSHPGCQNCTLRVNLNSLWDVGIRSEINYKETILEVGGKNLTCLLKLHSTCPKEHFE